MELAVFWWVVTFVARKVSNSAARKLNWERKGKQWGRGQGEKAVRKTACNQPHEILKRPSNLVSIGVWRTHDVTCFEVWRQPANCCSKSSLFFFVMQASCLWPFDVFFGLSGLSAHYLLGDNFVYWNWIVSLSDKNIDFFLNKRLIWSKK